MKVVDRHLSGEFLRLFGLTVASFLALFLMVDFFEHLRTLLRHDASLGNTLLFFAARMPWMVSQVIPMATLLGTVLSLILLARQGEITALRAAGLSLWRIAAPFLACGLALSLVTALIQEVTAPRGFALAQEVKHVRIEKHSPLSLLRTEDLWLRSGDRVVHVGRVGPEPGELHEVEVAELQGPRVMRRIDARTARWEGGAWVLEDATVRTFGEGPPETTHQAQLAYPLAGGPEDFEIAPFKPEEASWQDLRRRVERYRSQGLHTRNLEVDLWAKTSLPFVNLIMPLLAVPFAVGAGRRGGASAGVVVAVALGFAYWLVLALCLSLGKTGALPPPLAAWMANILFAGAGAALLTRAQRVG